jgi:zinc transport system substrate-binding protein
MVFALLCLIVLFGISSTRARSQKTRIEPETISVVSTFYPLAELAEAVGGSRVSVRNLTPTGVEPHDFEPTPQDLIELQQADIFVYNGAGFEAWVEKILPELTSKNVIIVNASAGLTSATNNDPHVWLDPVLMQKEVEKVAAALKQVDPEHTTEYDQRAAAYTAQLSTLDQEFQAGLQNCQTRTIFISHDAAGYLSRRYQLEVVSILGLSPDEEPSPGELASVVKAAKAAGARAIFFETLISPKLSETLAREVGAQTLVFNPLEGLTEEELNEGSNYFSIQRQNLTNLRLALQCQ